MFIWIIKQGVLSLVIIVLIHYLYIFLKNNLTVPKVKDLVNRPEQKYKEIYKSLNTPIKQSLEKPKQPQDMKTELKNYLKGLKPDITPASSGNIYNNNYETL